MFLFPSTVFLIKRLPHLLCLAPYDPVRTDFSDLKKPWHNPSNPNLPARENFLLRDANYTRADSHRVRDKPWSSQGPYRTLQYHRGPTGPYVTIHNNILCHSNYFRGKCVNKWGGGQNVVRFRTSFMSV